jgi:hypothetical protein
LIGVDGNIMEYIDKKQDAFPKDYYCYHAKSMHKYMNTKFKPLNWKVNVNCNKINFENIVLQNMHRRM